MREAHVPPSRKTWPPAEIFLAGLPVLGARLERRGIHTRCHVPPPGGRRHGQALQRVGGTRRRGGRRGEGAPFVFACALFLGDGRRL